VLSASDDGNVRIWKTNASQKLGPISTKERAAMEYRQKLVEQWSSEKHVRQIAERRHLPASVHNTQKLKREMLEARKVKEDRRRKHTRAGKEKPKAERKSESRESKVEIETGASELGADTARRGHPQGTEVSETSIRGRTTVRPAVTDHRPARCTSALGRPAPPPLPTTHVLYIACHPHII
jgi:WD repeat and SOF domain-containing protein 1